VDSVGIVLAAIGILNPLLAAFIHVSSEMTFILNSTRLLPKTSKRRGSLDCMEGLRRPRDLFES
jgi:hypothetical protein